MNLKFKKPSEFRKRNEGNSLLFQFILYNRYHSNGIGGTLMDNGLILSTGTPDYPKTNPSY